MRWSQDSGECSGGETIIAKTTVEYFT